MPCTRLSPSWDGNTPVLATAVPSLQSKAVPVPHEKALQAAKAKVRKVKHQHRNASIRERPTAYLELGQERVGHVFR